MRIPKSFRAGAYTWTVKVCKTAEKYKREFERYAGATLPAEDQNSYGCTLFRACVILINLESIGGSETLLLHTFLHEVEHVVQDTCGIPPGDHDEQEIDLRSGLLTQILLTGRPLKRT